MEPRQTNQSFLFIKALTSLYLLFFWLIPAASSEMVSGQSETETKPQAPTSQAQDIDELLKNYLASMSYSPQAVALPAEPEIYPTLSPDFINAGILPGSDADIQLPELPEIPSKKSIKTAKAGKLNFMKPVVNAILSSPFGVRWGLMHEGVDLAVSQGTPIVATEAGKVTYSGWASGYGNFISIDHGGGYASRYGHASALLVRSGQSVKKGQLIALVGSTGHSTGPHLHFELVNKGKHQNPLALINKTVQIATH